MKKLLLIIATTFALLAITINASIWFFQADIKQAIEKQVAQHSPVNISIDGKVKWSIISPLAITVTDIKASNGDSPLVHIRQISAGIGVASLWQSSIHISNIVLIIDDLQWHENTLEQLLALAKQKNTDSKSDEPSNLKLNIGDLHIAIAKLSAQQGNATLDMQQLNYRAKNTLIISNADSIIPIEKHRSTLKIQALSLNNVTLENTRLGIHIDKQNIHSTFNTSLAAGKVSTTVAIHLANNISLALKELTIDGLNIDQTWLDGIKALQQIDLDLAQKEPTKTQQDNNSLTLANLNIESINIKNLNIDIEQPSQLQIKDANLSFADQFLIKNKKWQVIPPTSTLSFQLNSNISSITAAEQGVNNIKIDMTASEHVIELKQFALNIFEGDIHTKGNIDASIATLPAKLSTTVSQLNVAELTKQTDYPSEGLLFADVESQLSLLPQERSSNGYIAGSNNTIRLYSKDNITVQNIDLDKLISSVQESTNISWTDIGAVGLFGPVGLLYSTALSLGSKTIKKSPGESVITHIDLNINNKGNLIAINNSLISTQANNISALGEIDYSNKTFKDFKIAFLNKQYCPTFIQQVSGTFEKPKIAASNLTKGLLFNTVGGLFSTKKLTGKRCVEFYEGQKTEGDKTANN